jgi:hypothetical protein
VTRMKDETGSQIDDQLGPSTVTVSDLGPLLDGYSEISKNSALRVSKSAALLALGRRHLP